MARRYEFFASAASREWLCFDVKTAKSAIRYGYTIFLFPCRIAHEKSPEIVEGWYERAGVCDYDPCFNGSVRPYSPVRRKDIPQDVLSRLEFPKESK